MTNASVAEKPHQDVEGVVVLTAAQDGELLEGGIETKEGSKPGRVISNAASRCYQAKGPSSIFGSTLLSLHS